MKQMESRKYTFNKSTLTVRFGNILESKAEVVVSSDDCDLNMGAEFRVPSWVRPAMQ